MITSRGFVYFIHRTSERMQLGTGLTTFLEFALKAAEDVVKGDTTLSWGAHIGAHATHANETLLLDSRPACGSCGVLSSSKIESTGTIA